MFILLSLFLHAVSLEKQDVLNDDLSTGMPSPENCSFYIEKCLALTFEPMLWPDCGKCLSFGSYPFSGVAAIKLTRFLWPLFCDLDL